MLPTPSFRVTPETYPDFFYTETIGDQTFYVRKVISVKVQEYREDLYRDRYEQLHADECKEGIDDVKYSAWLRSDEGDNETNLIDLKLLFIPKQPLPEDFPLDELVSVRQLRTAQGFLSLPSKPNTNAPGVSIESTATSAASEIPSDPQTA